MLERLKNTVRDTFVYSLSNIAPKIVGVILLPLFTKKLILTDFGNWDLIDNAIQILAEIVILGQASSIIFLNNRLHRTKGIYTFYYFEFCISYMRASSFPFRASDFKFFFFLRTFADYRAVC
jgi:O-antigen/teichoic acid export membrane protein